MCTRISLIKQHEGQTSCNSQLALIVYEDNNQLTHAVWKLIERNRLSRGMTRETSKRKHEATWQPKSTIRSIILKALMLAQTSYVNVTVIVELTSLNLLLEVFNVLTQQIQLNTQQSWLYRSAKSSIDSGIRVVPLIQPLHPLTQGSSRVEALIWKIEFSTCWNVLGIR